MKRCYGFFILLGPYLSYYGIFPFADDLSYLLKDKEHVPQVDSFSSKCSTTGSFWALIGRLSNASGITKKNVGSGHYIPNCLQDTVLELFNVHTYFSLSLVLIAI